MKNEHYKIPENCDFSKIYNANSEENQCSPKLNDKFFSEFSGILINAPKIVEWPKNVHLKDYYPRPSGTSYGPLRLMVAGLIRTQYKTLGLNGDTSEAVALVAINQETKAILSARMPRPDFDLPPDFENESPERTRNEAELNALITNHFNFDLVHDLGLPIAEANYQVYATLGAMKSNVVEVKTVIK